MEHKKWELVLALLLIAAVSFAAGHPSMLSVTAIPTKTIVVGIDAGHGGMDCGKIGVNQALEKDINLAIALLVKQKLTDQGITVVMSRETDEGLYAETDTNKKQIDMRNRCKKFEEENCDIVVSIHQNSYHEEGVSGPQVFYYTTSVQGKILAETLQKQLVEDLRPSKERVAKENDTYYLLRKVPCPIVIVECAFLSNWGEAELLKTAEYQEKVAESITKGILVYLTSQNG